MFRSLATYIVFISSLFFVSCNFNSSEDFGKVVARVGDSYLYESDINKLFNSEVSKSDSVLIVDAFVNRWARKKIILQKAEMNLSEEEADFNRLIEEYREGLITSAYKQKLVTKYLDTAITTLEVESFYEENKTNFILNNDLVMLKYATFPIKISEKRKIVKMMKSDKLEDFSKLEALCYQFSDDFALSDSSWMPLHNIKMKVVHLKSVKSRELLKKDNFIEKQDSLHLYLTRILDVREKGEIAPLSFVEDRIHNIIINRRKLELMKNMENQLMEDAIKNREFETFK